MQIQMKELSQLNKRLNTSSKKLIYLAIKNKSDGNWVSMSYEEIRSYTTCSIKTIKNVIRILIQLKLIEKKNISGTANQYRWINPTQLKGTNNGTNSFRY